MERRLLKAIVNPSMLAVFITGAILAYQTGYWQSTWLHIKIALTLCLAALHGYFARYVKIFAKDENPRTPRFFRILNEVPTVLMVLIVLSCRPETVLALQGRATAPRAIAPSHAPPCQWV